MNRSVKNNFAKFGATPAMNGASNGKNNFNTSINSKWKKTAISDNNNESSKKMDEIHREMLQGNFLHSMHYFNSMLSFSF